MIIDRAFILTLYLSNKIIVQFQCHIFGNKAILAMFNVKCVHFPGYWMLKTCSNNKLVCQYNL